MAEKIIKRAKGFGTRYGKKVREKVQAIRELRKASGKCPYCRAVKVSRVAFGIWECGKCGKKFTGRAYGLAEVKVQEMQE